METTNENEPTQASLSDDSTSWTAPLLFPCQLRMCGGRPLPFCSNTYEELDINAHITSPLYGRSFRLYFDPNTYPPPTGQAKLSDENHAIFERIKTDLQMSAFKNGQSIVCDGSNDGRAKNKVFVCFRSRTHKSLGQRKRQRKTSRPSEQDHVCRYRFTIRWDDAGYYVPLGASHAHHAKLGPDALPPARLTRQVQVEDDDDSIGGFPDLSNSEDEGTFYDAVNPSFEALCRALEHNFTSNDVDRTKAFFEQLTNEKKRQQNIL